MGGQNPYAAPGREVEGEVVHAAARAAGHRDVGAFARLVVLVVGLNAAASLSALLLQATMTYAQLQGEVSLAFTVSDETLHQFDGIRTLLRIGAGLSAVALIGLWLRNAAALGVAGVRLRSLIWALIPLVNVIGAYVLLRNLWNAFNPDITVASKHGPAPRRLVAWWVAWIGFFFAMRKVHAHDVWSTEYAFQFIVALAIDASAWSCAAWTLYGIQRRQELRHAKYFSLEAVLARDADKTPKPA